MTKNMSSLSELDFQGVRNLGGPGVPGPPQYFGKICIQISKKGYFENFITLLGPPQ